MSRTAVHTMCRPGLSEFSLASPSSLAPNSGMYSRSADHASFAKAPLPWKQALITLTGLPYSSELPAPRSLSPGSFGGRPAFARDNDRRSMGEGWRVGIDY